MALGNEVLYVGFMPISPDIIEAIDFEHWAHCWVMIRCEHEPVLKALLNAVTAGRQFLYTPVSEFHLHGLSPVQQAELIAGREDVVYRDRHCSIFVLEELWCEVEDAVAQIARNTVIEHRIAVHLSFADAQTIEHLRTELRRNPVLNYVEIDFGED